MKIAITDIETTGIDYELHSIIEVGVVILDTSESAWKLELSDFYSNSLFSAMITPDPRWVWNAWASEHHKESGLYQEAMDNGQEAPHAIKAFQEFLRENMREDGSPLPIVLSGKNYGMFDHNFLKKANFFRGLKHCHRVIDVGNYYVDWDVDKEPPDLATCMERAGLDVEIKHRALDDAIVTAYLVSKFSLNHRQVWQ